VTVPPNVSPTFQPVALHGERLAVPERMIVAPAAGVFRPHRVDEGVTVHEGDEIGVLEGPRTQWPVRSPFRGTLMGMLAHPGERLRAGQPVAWLRVA
jgi:biotin carboxyl carrier protein